MSLRDHFNQIAVISLPERKERRAYLLENLTKTGLAHPKDLKWIEAIDGRKVAPPEWWQQGAGAWGCRLSHLDVLRNARQNNLETILILEDDVVFHPRAQDWLPAVMSQLPTDWGQFYLGGQYSEDPLKTENALILRSQGITRTHAYAVHRSLYDQLISVIENVAEYQDKPRWHIDHQYNWHQQQGHWKTYAPAWWLAGQEEGETDIAKGQLPRRWWQQGLHFWKLPFIRVGTENPKTKELFFAKEPTSHEPFDLAHWFRRAAFEAWNQGRLPGISEHLFSESEIRRYWPAGSKDGAKESLAALTDYPANGLFEHPFSQIKTTN